MASPETQSIVLSVGGRSFVADKELLRKNSLYFEAMFSGRFKEDKQSEVVIEMVTADAMEMILKFLKGEKNKFTEVSETSDLLQAARFLQIDQLVEDTIEYLTLNINLVTWCDIYEIAKDVGLDNLQVKAKTFGLYEFQSVKENILSIKTLASLHWYLSHQSLSSESEIEVFETGCKWIEESNCSKVNGILVIVSCLDYNQLSDNGLISILENKLVQSNDMAKQILICLQRLRKIYSKGVPEQLRSEFPDEVYEIAIMSLKGNQRELHERPWIIGTLGGPVCPPIIDSCESRIDSDDSYFVVEYKKVNESKQPIIFQFDTVENKLCSTMEIAGKNWWGYSVASWSGYKLLLVFGEMKRGMNSFNKELRMYNTLTEKWSVLHEDVERRRHAGVAVGDNKLFAVGGVGPFRMVLATVKYFDLQKHTWHKLPHLPEALQNPAVTFHKSTLFVAAHNYCYMLCNYQDEDKAVWIPVDRMSMKSNSLVSLGDCLYTSQNYTNLLAVLDPCPLQCEKSERELKRFTHHVSALCKSGKELYAFTEFSDFEENHRYVEKANISDPNPERPTEILWSDSDEPVSFYSVAGSFPMAHCTLEDVSVAEWGKKWLD